MIEPTTVSSLPADIVGEQIYERFQRWRRRQQKQWNGLFNHSLGLSTSKILQNPDGQANAPPLNPPTHLTVQKIHDGRMRILINDRWCLFCDACGTLLPIGNVPHLLSSDSTIDPSRSNEPQITNHFVRCHMCCFVTPLGTLRRLLRISSSAGPEFSRDLAFAVLVEAVGVEQAMRDKELHPWFLDKTSRMSGMDELFGVIGIREEQITDSGLNTAKQEPHSDISSRLQYAEEAEKFLKATIPESKLPSIPFSVSDLIALPETECMVPSSLEKARAAADRASALVLEAVRIWEQTLQRGQSTLDHLHKGLLKVQALGREYMVEQTHARRYNHSALHVPKKIQETQSQQPSKHDQTLPQ